MPSPHPKDVSEKASPYVQKSGDVVGTELTPTVKSYRNDHFLNSHDGRLIRIICEFEEPQQRLRRNCLRSTCLFFGSARAMKQEQYDSTVAALLAKAENATDAQEQERLRKEVQRLGQTEWMCKWVNTAEVLSRMIAIFARDHAQLIDSSFLKWPDYFRTAVGPDGTAESLSDVGERCHDFVVTTGGGPGFMEAANRGAASVLGTKTMGMGISLPFEKGLNPYVTDDLAFTFHYFFTRKYWMMYSCRAIIVAPGGFGTLDETFELLTLRQTKKIPNLPVVLLGTEFWRTVVNWQALADYGVISQHEVDGLCFTDSPEEAIEFIRSFYQNLSEE